MKRTHGQETNFVGNTVTFTIIAAVDRVIERNDRVVDSSHFHTVNRKHFGNQRCAPPGTGAARLRGTGASRPREPAPRTPGKRRRAQVNQFIPFHL